MAVETDVNQAESPKLGKRFDSALQFASNAHRHQLRKGVDVPYLAHLLSVTGLVLESGGDEDLAIGALLHDAAEDQGGRKMLGRIQDQFGARVAGVVEGCSDTLELPKPAWLVRKQAYIDHIRDFADLGTCLVSAADKVHNSRSILEDHYLLGDAVFDRFKKSKDHTMWYYRALREAFRLAAVRLAGSDPLLVGFQRLTDRFDRTLTELELRTGTSAFDPCHE